MGHPFGRDRFLIDLFRAMAALATGVTTVATMPPARYIITRSGGWLVFAQSSFVQTDADVRRSEANQWGRQLGLGESLPALECIYGARLSLLVATVADCVRLVGGQNSRMVQTFFRRLLPGR